MVRQGSALFLMVSWLGIAGCNASLPEPASPEAQLYQRRCSGCHRLYAPQILTAQMWTVMVDRMELEFRRRGLPPLSSAEKQLLLAYLQKHSQKVSDLRVRQQPVRPSSGR